MPLSKWFLSGCLFICRCLCSLYHWKEDAGDRLWRGWNIRSRYSPFFTEASKVSPSEVESLRHRASASIDWCWPVGKRAMFSLPAALYRGVTQRICLFCGGYGWVLFCCRFLCSVYARLTLWHDWGGDLSAYIIQARSICQICGVCQMDNTSPAQN